MQRRRKQCKIQVGSVADYRVHELQPGYDFMLSLECDLQPVGTTLLEHEWLGLQVAHFAFVSQRVDDVSVRPVLKLQTEFDGHNLHRAA